MSKSPLPVAGYTSQPTHKIDVVNTNKVLEEKVLRQIDDMKREANIKGFDGRMIALAHTKIQEAFMWLNRSVFQPQRLTDEQMAEFMDSMCGKNDV